MGQTPSQPPRRASETQATFSTADSSSVSEDTAERESDPIPHAPSSPAQLAASLQPPKPTLPTLETKSSFIKLRKTSPAEANLPKPPIPSLGSRIARKMSKSRNDIAAVRAGPESGFPSGAQQPPARPLRSDLRPGYSGALSPSTPIAKLSSSLGSSTLSGPSTSLVTPSASRRNLNSSGTPITPRHQIRPFPPQPIRRCSSAASSFRSPSAAVIPSGHASKARTRAEREWRARVAAISAEARARAAGLEIGDGTKKEEGESPAYKGPVPPRRRRAPQASVNTAPTTSKAVFSSSQSDIPSHLSTPQYPHGRSISSSRSFETLGHHAHTHCPSSLAAGDPSHTLYRSPPSHHRRHSRQDSFPQSIGSFYADSPKPLRPIASLSSLKRTCVHEEHGAVDARTGIVGRDSAVDVEDETIPLGMGAGGMAHLYKSLKNARQTNADDLPFDITLAQPNSKPPLPLAPPFVPPLLSLPLTPKHNAAPTSSRTPARGADLPRRSSLDPATTSSIGHCQVPETPRSRARKERIMSLPTIDTSPTRTPNRAALPRPSIPFNAISSVTSPTPRRNPNTSFNTDATSPSLPSLLSYTLSTPTPTKQSTSGSAATPTTPYSPMTTYILSAPSIDLSFPMQDSVPTSPQGWLKGYCSGSAEERRGEKASCHPYASCLDRPSPPRAQGGLGAENEGRRAGVRNLANAEGQENRIAAMPRICQPPNNRKVSTIPSPTSGSAHPLRLKMSDRRTAPRDAILGSTDRQKRTRGKVELDLCPGMGIGGGTRPPKRGMDRSDLERWLAGTQA